MAIKNETSHFLLYYNLRFAIVIVIYDLCTTPLSMGSNGRQ
jgi:hypothetical protein